MDEYEKIGRELVEEGYVDHKVIEGVEKVRISGKGVIAYELLRDLVEEATKK